LLLPITTKADAANASSKLENELANSFRRTRFVRSINDTIRGLANSGLVDLPQHPGMAAIPIAVYRAVQGPELQDMMAIEP
jgi:hypothetical protein